MTKPVGIVKGGLDELKTHFQTKLGEKFGQAYGGLVLGLICTIGAVGCFFIAKHYINKIREREIERVEKEAEIEDLSCIHCKENKRSILFEPCYHMLYCDNCYNNANQLPANSHEKCGQCHKDIVDTQRIYFP